MALSVGPWSPGNLLPLLWLRSWLWREADLPVRRSLPRGGGTARSWRGTRREAGAASRHRLQCVQVQHVASFKHVRIDVRLHHVLELLAAAQVLRGRWHVRILVHAELEALLNGLEGRHLRGWDLRVRALGGDGLVAVLHHEVSLRALHEVLLELGGRRVSVGVGVLLEAVLAELGALTVEVEAAVVLVDRQGLRRRSLFDDALLVASSCLAKSWPRHDVVLVSCLNLYIAPAGN